MRRLLPRLATSILTFFIGVCSSYLNPPTVIVGNHTVKRSVRLEIMKPAAPSCFPGLSQDLASIPQDENSFFPNISTRRDDFRVSWYSQYLKAMHEPSFVTLQNDETYRFLWLRSFHHPVAVRVWRAGGEYFFTVKELNGAGGYEPGRLIVNRAASLTPHEWEEFTWLLEKSCFWNTSTHDSEIGIDGAQWILEGAKKRRYHVVDRWSPEGGDFRAACLYLLKISGLGFDEKSKDLY